MRRRRQTLRDVIRKRLEAYQESILHNLKYYPSEPQRSVNLRYSLQNNIDRTFEAVLNHLKSVEVEERAEWQKEQQELFEEA